jgi:hypothetical protein
MARKHRPRELERLLRRRERLGLTYRELSEESGIPIPTLSWWSRRLREVPAGGDSCELVAVEVVDEQPLEEMAIEIRCGDGLRVMVPASASLAHVARVLGAVASAC